MNGLFHSISLAWLTAAAVVCSASSPAQLRPLPPLPSKETAEQYRRNIQAELGTTGLPPWAGEYSIHPNHILRLAPRAGYTSDADLVGDGHCAIGFEVHVFGTVSTSGPILQLTPEFSLPETSRLPTEALIPVSWGGRYYLIEQRDMVEFCEAVNWGSEPRRQERGLFLLRRGDHDKPVVGFPDVPQEYSGFLLPNPIDAHVIDFVTSSVEQLDGRPGPMVVRDMELVMDAGSRSGVLPGMHFYEVSSDWADLPAKVVTVTETTSSAKLFVVLRKDRDLPQPSTWIMTTQRPPVQVWEDGSESSLRNPYPASLMYGR